MRRWLYVLFIAVFVLLSNIVADPIIYGPDDDPYIVDDSIETTPPPPGMFVNPDDFFYQTIISLQVSQLDCGMFPYMCTYVEALDSTGDPIGSLTSDSFCVYQDGTPISSFTVEELTQDSCITSICLVIDLSGSMNTNNKIGAARDAAHDFVDKMDIYDRVAIVTFASCYNVVQDFTSDQALLHSKINTLSAYGWTAAFDGIWKGVDLTTTELGSKAVIAITDGMENRSQYCGGSGTPDGLSDGYFGDDSTLICDLANGASIPIYTISLGSSFDPQYLIKLANATGGTYNHAPTGDDIEFVYDEIKTRLCSRYLICYDSPDTVQNGDWHTIQICRRNPDGSCSDVCDTSSCQEVAPPVIVRTPPTISLDSTCQLWDTEVEICAYITDLDTPQEDLTVQLFYRNSDTVGYTSVTMNRTDSLYCYSIPSSELTCATDSLQYYVTASDGLVTVSLPQSAPTSHFAFPVCENHAPTVAAGADQTISQCTPSEICWSVTYGDIDGNLELVEKLTGPGTYDGSQICFTPTGTLDYEFVMRAVDSCGLEGFDTVVVYYSLNTAPVADAGADASFFQCTPTEICWPASCTDVDGNLQSCVLNAGTGTYDGTNICFTPDTSGVYRFILDATDDCSATDADTAFITVTLNVAPICTVPSDISIFQCAPTQVCLPYSASDVDNNLQSCQIISGPGSLVGGDWCYTPTTDQAVTVTLRCQDSCGAYCESSFTVTFDINEAPALSLGADSSIFLCASEEVCLPFTSSDGDAGQSTTLSLLSAFGTLNELSSELCFTPDTVGTYIFVASITDSCGVAAFDTLAVSISFNSAPVADAGADQSVFQCVPTEICWSAGCSDVDGNLTNCDLISGPGSYNGSQICFTPGSATASYEFILKATDACGVEDYDTVSIDVTINSAPVMTAQADTSLFLCTSQEVCVSYSATDADASHVATLVETMISGYGALDAANDRICFTPTVSGDYEFIIGVTDGCGATDEDTVVVSVTFGEFASIDCPTSAFDEFLCVADSIIQPLTITPSTATVSVSEGIYADGAVRFLASSAGTYNIEVIADESCGSDTCTVTFNVTLNTAPMADAGVDNAIFQCVPAEICWAAGCSDVDGNLTSCDLISGPGSYNGSQICFTPGAATASYEFILKATDACGVEDYDTVSIDVTINSAPVMTAQSDTSLFLCASQEICVSYTVFDADGLKEPPGLIEALISGYGTIDTDNDIVCFTPTASGDYEFIIGVTDGCGATDEDTVVVSVTMGEFASIDCPTSAFDEFLCVTDSIIQPLTITPLTATVSVSEGIYADGAIRFLASSAGTYNIEVIADESCGSDTCTVTFNVTLNTAPVADAGTDNDIFQCVPAEICWSAGCSDVDGNLTSCDLISGPGSYNGSQICFTPGSSTASYEFILKATDACGVEDYDTVNIDVTINSAPVMTAQADTSLFLCVSQEICVSYTVFDADGLKEPPGLIETLISGYGTIDTDNDVVCFTPTASGVYEFIIGVTDGCGATDEDTVVVSVTFGEFASIDCPVDPIPVSLCDTVEVCRMLDITPASASVSVSLGTYSGGQHCFSPDTSGIYIVEIIADASCGSDTCEIVYNVDIGQAAEIACPASQSLFICEAGDICVPISVVTPEAVFTITPIGTYTAGNICFDADTSGHYEINIIATTDCGADTCDIIADIVINSTPVAVIPTSPIDTFICSSDQICYQFGASDANGGTLIWTKLSGDGAITSGGNWCFDVTGDGSWSISAVVTDSCTAADTVSLTYNVDINSGPMVALPNDTAIFICEGSQYCFNYTATDSDNNIVTEQLLSATGTIDINTNTVCFTPAASGVYQFIVQAIDACGAQYTDTADITVDFGLPLSITCPADTTVFQCTPTQICRPVTISLDTLVTVTPIGSYSAGQVCFTPDTSGHYVINVSAASVCGGTDCSFAVDVVLNSPPVAVMPTTPVDTFICAAASICYQFSANDVDGGALTWSKISGDGSITPDGNWCFTASGTNIWTMTTAVSDLCGASDTVSMTYNISLNSDPIVTVPNDTSLFLCDGQSYCFNYVVSDADNNVAVEELMGGTGTIDTVTNEICFTPTASEIYQFIVRATDECGGFSQDIINIDVQFGVSLDVSCPVDTVMFLCEPGQICRPVDITIDTLVTVSPIGTYDAGNVCFNADTSGVYDITVAALSACGSDSCIFRVYATVNDIPVATDPPSPVDTFICATDDICYQFSAIDSEGGALTWSRLSGAGTVDASGLWCFSATANGSYTVSALVADTCGNADTVSLQYNVIINTSPVLTLPFDTTVFMCGPEEFCFDYSVDDPDDNIVMEEILQGGGTLDTLNNRLCFTPTMAGTWQFIVGVKDECGDYLAGGVDTIEIEVVFNSAPIANAGDDHFFFQCGKEDYCFPVTCTDPDNNLDTCYIYSGDAQMVGNQVCVNVDTAGIYEIVIRAEDECGLTGDDTMIVSLTINLPPVCSLPSDTTLFQCGLTEASLPLGVTDPDNNFDHWTLVSGPGAIVSGNWTHTPSGNESDTIVVQAHDECGAFCEGTFIVNFEINRAPIAHAGDDMQHFFCSPGETYCWAASCSDPDGNLSNCELVSDDGTYDAGTGEICFYVATGIERSYAFILEATDSCGLIDTDTSWLTVEFNDPPAITLPSDFQALVLGMGEICFEADIEDENGNLESYSVSPIGAYNETTGQICFDTDTTGVYTIVVSAVDSCGAETVDTIIVGVEIDECLFVQIEYAPNVYQGHYRDLNITLNGSGKDLGGFDILIAYDPSVIIASGAEAGQLFENCDWEYFTYRFGESGNCENCPTGILRLVGLAETNNGAYHPSCTWQGQIGTIASVTFYVPNNYTHGGQFAPVEFFWFDCADNSFSSILGDTLWVSRVVYDIEWNNITNYSYGFPGGYGVPDYCLDPDESAKTRPERCVDFTNGGIVIIHPDSIDARGDVNLNGIANEVSDAVMFTNFFISGLSAFGEHVEGSIAASDVNGDGTALSVADLVYLIRVIIGDAAPLAKPLPGAKVSLEVYTDNKSITVDYSSNANIGAMALIFNVNAESGAPILSETTNTMDVVYNAEDGQLRVLIYNIGANSILPGQGRLLSIPVSGKAELVRVEAADYFGRPLSTTIENIPRVFELSQNYPNPFNPVTTIQFSLPEASDWSLTVYNILGQVVETWSGTNEAGSYDIVWKAEQYATGVYLYQLKAGANTQSKKMILLK
ncbi:MAG: VWA domain-containing protein [candidate division Zixibacteria bacterium]|nr:VWA domain-containing protein [candidate division Zixibacteria bacterium]